MLKSIEEKERIIEIDIIRGIAILGIFFVNLPEMLVAPMVSIKYMGMDGWVRLIYNTLIQTKFYTIFSFLFGLGFYIFMSRAEARGDKMYKLFFRRLFFLFIFGGIHFILFWHGDILNTYALIGIWLLLFYNKKPKTILTWAGVLLCTAFALNVVIYSPTVLEQISTTALLQEELPVYNYLRSFTDNFLLRVNLFGTQTVANGIILTPEILSLFLIGLYVGKKDVFSRIEELAGILKKMQIVSLIVSVLCFIPMVKLYLESSTYRQLDQYFFVWFSGKTMAIFYVTTILLLLRKEKWRKRLKSFTYVGKMALTNYIGQTIVSIFVFSMVFKNTAKIPLWVGLLYCPIFYIGQIQFSKWWLSTHKMGPLEWLWRYATYYNKTKKNERFRRH